MSESVSHQQDSWPEFVEEPIELSPPLESHDVADSDFAIGLSPAENVPFVTARLKDSNSALGNVLRESGALNSTTTDRSLKEEFETLRRTAEVTEQPVAAEEPYPDPLPVDTNNLEPAEIHSRPVRQQPLPQPDPSSLEFGSEQWPVLLSQEEEPPSSSWKLFVAVGVLLALGAGAGAAYYFFIRPKQDETGQVNSQKSKAPPAGSTATQSPSLPAGASPSAKPEDAGRAQASVSTAAGPAPSAPPSAASQADALQGKYSLQAASFPSAMGANEFAEKLHRAGVPAYVVSADIPGKGRWFRVRVGRFGTRDEATRFAADAKLRARAAGLSLQLVPCDYETPGK